MTVSPLALLARLAVAYAALRYGVHVCEQLTSAGGFPSGTGKVVAAGILGLYSTMMLMEPLRTWSPWQYAWYFCASVIIISGPVGATFTAFTDLSDFWAESWGVCIAATVTGVVLRLALWDQDSRQQQADDDADD